MERKGKKGGEGEGRGKVHICQQSVLMKVKRRKIQSPAARARKNRNQMISGGM